MALSLQNIWRTFRKFIMTIFVLTYENINKALTFSPIFGTTFRFIWKFRFLIFEISIFGNFEFLKFRFLEISSF